METSLLNLVDFLACLCTIGTAVAGAIVWIRKQWNDDGYTIGEGKGPVVVVGTIVMIIVIVLAGVLVSRAAAGTPIGRTTVYIFPQSSQNGNPVTTPIVTSIPTATTIPTAMPTSTATLAPFPTSSPILPPYSSGVISPNWRLDCGGCDEPVRVMVTQVAIDAGNENMVWTFAFDNHTAKDIQEVYFNQLYLTDPNGVQHPATGAARTSPGTPLRAGQTASLQATFAFLPRYGATYTLKATLYNGDGLFSWNYTDYGPQTITF